MVAASRPTPPIGWPRTPGGTAAWQIPGAAVFSTVARLVLSTVTTVYLAVFIVALAWMALGPAQQGWPALLRELLNLLFAPAVPLLVLAALLRARLCMLSLLPPLVLMPLLLEPQLIPRLPEPPGGTGFRVLDLNTGAAHRLNDPTGIIRLVESASPDLICLVEARPDTLNTVGQAILTPYPYQAGAGAIFVLSRFPLSDVWRDEKLPGTKDNLQVTVEIDRRLVDLSVVHFQQPAALPGLRAGIGSLMRAGSHFSTTARDEAVDQVLQRLRHRSGSQLLVGDFNLTPTSAAYRRLSAELHDAYRAGGWGLGYTFPESRPVMGLDLAFPVIRIDYIFHTPDLRTLRAWAWPESPSDHLPVVADLVFR
jgi:vancomycin resistance protein VanJ